MGPAPIVLIGFIFLVLVVVGLDRILIAQSLEEKLPLVTSDPLFDRYPIRVIW